MSFLREPGAEPIPGYRLIEPLGSGGFGEAWKCVAPGDILKAIKFVFGNLNSLDVEGARAEQELKALHRVKQVRYPFVLPMDRIEVVDGELVIVMELADRSLHDAYEEALSAGLRGIPRDALLRYIRDAADALDHMAGLDEPLQHLDIKPRNLFLVSDRVKVADFGLVKYVQSSNASGLLGGVTPLYAPPETFLGQVSCNSDQYSLALVYMELLTGQRPYTAKNVRQMAQAHMSAEPDLRALPEAERPIVLRALSKKPEDRWPNCLSFIRAVLMARPAVSAPPVVPNRSVNRPRTLADSMEDIFLDKHPGQVEDELVPVDEDEGIDLGATAHTAPEQISRLGVTMALPQTGSLRPTLVLGLGAFGRRALLELRCRLIDRFGDLDKLPMFRFLYIDSDQDAIRASLRAAPELAFSPNEVYQLSLQPVSHYRRRQIDQLADWLPREKLYALPRSLKTQGSRALGRLAFTDNYLRLQSRLKRELQAACHPDVIYESVGRTGLALRDNLPRVYILASAAGGSSGSLVDLGYTIRRLYEQMRQPEGQVVSMLFLGAPEDPATPQHEMANVYATLTEIHHFTEPGIPFSAQYGTDGPRLSHDGPAFDASYLIPISNRTPEARREALSHLGSYLYHEITTPLGIRLERSRSQKHPGATPFRSFGTFGVWYPRGLMLRLAAWSALSRMLEFWQSTETGGPTPELDACHARLISDPGLQADALTGRIIELAGGELEAAPAEALTHFLATLEEQSQHVLATEDPGNWARQTVQRTREWLGSGLLSTSQELSKIRGELNGFNPIHQRKSKLTRALETAAVRLAAEWDERMTQSVAQVMEHPGERLAIAEVALVRLIQVCDDGGEAMRQRVEQQNLRTRRALDHLETAVQNCTHSSGGFSWFGGKTRRLLRVFLDHLAAFSRQCLAEDLTASVWQFFLVLRGRLQDRLRDITLCRQRLRHAVENLGSLSRSDDLSITTDDGPTPTCRMAFEKFWELLSDLSTARVVLPDGNDLEEAAQSFLATLTPEQWGTLDQSYQDEVLGARGGLYRACTTVGDITKHLIMPLLNQTISYLGSQLPITDVAEVELSLDPAIEGQPGDRIPAYFDSAVPLIQPERAEVSSHRVPEATPNPADAPGFLLIPASEAGKEYGQEAEQVLPKITLVPVPGQAELMICREQPVLTLEDLDRVLKPCRRAYHTASATPNLSPHARFDIIDWSPIDP